MATIRVHITFPPPVVKEPFIYRIGHEYNVITNIRRADVTEKTGWVDLELSGEIAEIERAIENLKTHGVSVDPIERNIIE